MGALNDKDLKIVEKMEQYGGGFVKSLANCFRHADALNRIRLITTFRIYWNLYKKMVIITCQRCEKKEEDEDNLTATKQYPDGICDTCYDDLVKTD